MVKGNSVVVPLIIPGLPEEIDVLGRRWARKCEFHLTAISAQTVEGRGGGNWKLVRDVASGRSLGPIAAGQEIRRVRHPEKPELHTLIVMAHAAGLDDLYDEMSIALGVSLQAPPAHVTLYSTDPEQGIGIDTADELDERAPSLSRDEQDAVLQAIGWA